LSRGNPILIGFFPGRAGYHTGKEKEALPFPATLLSKKPII
jgi:hypothetical protein